MKVKHVDGGDDSIIFLSSQSILPATDGAGACICIAVIYSTNADVQHYQLLIQSLSHIHNQQALTYIHHIFITRTRRYTSRTLTNTRLHTLKWLRYCRNMYLLCTCAPVIEISIIHRGEIGERVLSTFFRGWWACANAPPPAPKTIRKVRDVEEQVLYKMVWSWAKTYTMLALLSHLVEMEKNDVAVSKQQHPSLVPD